MSGGSFNYLEYRLGEQREYEQLLDDARRLGVRDDQRAMVDLYAIIGCLARAEVLRAKLEPIVHAVEWACSGDWGPEDVVKTAEEYEAKHGSAR